MSVLTVGYILFIFAAAGAAVFWISQFIHKRYFMETLKLRTLLIRLTQKLGSEDKDFLKEINYTGQLLSGLVNSKIPFSLESAVHHIGKEINFYVSVPINSVDFTMRQIQGLWADAYIEEVDDYNIFNHQGISQGVYLKQKEIYALPIRTYEDANLDTFLPILNSLSTIQEIGEGAAIQILVKPAPKSFKKTLADFIYRLKKGDKLEDLLSSNTMITISDIKKALSTKDKAEEKEQVVIDEETIKSFEKKIAKQMYSVVMRLVVSAPSQSRADEILETIAGSFDQFQAPLRNGIKAMKPRNQKEFLFNYIFRIFEEKEQMVLGTDELISLFHLPTSMMEIPHIGWLKSRESAAPMNLPKSGTLLGESSFRGERQPIFISDEDRRRHVYIIGQTGTGKTTLMKNMVLEDIKAGKGVAVIDPHGDLIESIAGLVPQNRMEDVVVFDPGDLAHPLGLNFLEYDPDRPEQKTFIANEMLEIFRKLFPDAGEGLGPMFQQYMRNSLLLLMEDAKNEPTTLMDVPRVFTDEAFRKGKLLRCQNPVVKDFWEREATMVGGEASLQNITPYITSKFNTFIANDYVRPIISQPKSSLRFREMMDSGKILLINLSKGRIGDLNANLLGMIVVGKILMAALSRTDIAQEKRRDFNLYIDEFQNVTTDSIATILSEARKYRLNLVIAHQFIAQLEEKIRDAVFGNVGSMVVFRVGADDAEKIIKQFEPVFTNNDLINIDNFNAYAKILINGQTSKPFNLKISPSPKSDDAVRDHIKELSRKKYGPARQGL